MKMLTLILAISIMLPTQSTHAGFLDYINNILYRINQHMFARSLVDAIMSNDFEGVIREIRAGANINTKHYSDCTLIHYAALKGDTYVMRLFLTLGADMYAQDKLGETPLDTAIKLGHTETIELLTHTMNKYSLFLNDPLNKQINTSKPDYLTPVHLLRMLYNTITPIKEAINGSVYYINPSEVLSYYIQNNKTEELKDLIDKCDFNKLDKYRQQQIRNIGLPITGNELHMQETLALQYKNSQQKKFADIFFFIK